MFHESEPEPAAGRNAGDPREHPREHPQENTQQVVVRGTDLRLLPAAAATWIGALAGLHLAEAPKRLWPLAIFAVVSLGLLVPSHTRIGAVASFATCLSLVVASGAASALDEDPLTQAAAEQRYATVVGTVVKPPTPSSAKWKTDTLTTAIEVQELRLGKTWYGSDAGLRLEIGDVRDLDWVATNEIPKGTMIRFEGTVKEPSFINGTTIVGMSIDHFQVVRQAAAWQKTVAKLRSTMSQVTESAAGSLGPLITGMAIGDDDGLDRDAKQAMLTTSLTHLTAVSGSHIAISLAVIHVLFRGRPKVQAVLVAGFLVLVLAVVGAEPSVVRATSMSALAAWGMFRRRPGQPLALLFTVVISVILWDPWSAVSLGFALSAIATLGILTWGRAMAKSSQDWVDGFVKRLEGRPWWERHQHVLSAVQWFLEATSDVVAISLSAYVVALPVLSLVNPWLPTWGLLANILVAPIVAPLTLLGVSVAVTCLPVPAVAGVLARVAVPFAWWMNKVNMTLATWPLARTPWPEGARGAVLLAVLLALTFVGARCIRRIVRGRDRPFRCLESST